MKHYKHAYDRNDRVSTNEHADTLLLAFLNLQDNMAA